MNARPIVPVVALVVALAAGCTVGGPGPDKPSAPAPVSSPLGTPETSREPAGSEVSTEEAAATYEEIVEPWNSNIREWNAALAKNDLEQLRELAAENATLMQDMADGLLAAEWPADVQPLIDQMVGYCEVEADLWAQAGEATSEEELWAPIDQLPVHNTGELIRKQLGLDAAVAG
ncbi:hypothetical protein [Actinotalea sp. JY-7885]|uniref:hypothetical protein n=1 Tax=Actinotalea sp. JY-7885 TaxID=2758576 RepID=UPI00165DB6E0|nr:hypothetical protein [Actinotalea sp. JY-7885]